MALPVLPQPVAVDGTHLDIGDGELASLSNTIPTSANSSSPREQ